VLSSTDFNVLLDPSRKAEFKSAVTGRIPFKMLRGRQLTALPVDGSRGVAPSAAEHPHLPADEAERFSLIRRTA
jgi:hypothetical protein